MKQTKVKTLVCRRLLSGELKVSYMANLRARGTEATLIATTLTCFDLTRKSPLRAAKRT